MKGFDRHQAIRCVRAALARLPHTESEYTFFTLERSIGLNDPVLDDDVLENDFQYGPNKQREHERWEQLRLILDHMMGLLLMLRIVTIKTERVYPVQLAPFDSHTYHLTPFGHRFAGFPRGLQAVILFSTNLVVDMAALVKNYKYLSTCAFLVWGRVTWFYAHGKEYESLIVAGSALLAVIALVVGAYVFADAEDDRGPTSKTLTKP